MRFHGLVLLSVLGLSQRLMAQGSSPSAEVFMPPSPQKSDAGSVVPMPLPPAVGMNTTTTDMEAELRQFRSELREFQALREDVARTAKTADSDAERVSQQQRQELVEMLTKLARKNMTRKPVAPPVTAEPELPFEEPAPPMLMTQPSTAPLPSTDPINLDVSVDIADAFALGKVLFRSGDFAGAERAFRKVVATPENEMTLKYLTATCLRRQSRWQQAIESYKVVADSNRDPVLKDLAKWQLDNIRWLQESESQLEKMRKQREKQSHSQSAKMSGMNP